MSSRLVRLFEEGYYSTPSSPLDGMKRKTNTKKPHEKQKWAADHNKKQEELESF